MIREFLSGKIENDYFIFSFKTSKNQITSHSLYDSSIQELQK